MLFNKLYARPFVATSFNVRFKIYQNESLALMSAEMQGRNNFASEWLRARSSVGNNIFMLDFLPTTFQRNSKCKSAHINQISDVNCSIASVHQFTALHPNERIQFDLLLLLHFVWFHWNRTRSPQDFCLSLECISFENTKPLTHTMENKTNRFTSNSMHRNETMMRRGPCDPHNRHGN